MHQPKALHAPCMQEAKGVHGGEIKMMEGNSPVERVLRTQSNGFQYVYRSIMAQHYLVAWRCILVHWNVRSANRVTKRRLRTLPINSDSIFPSLAPSSDSFFPYLTPPPPGSHFHPFAYAGCRLPFGSSSLRPEDGAPLQWSELIGVDSTHALQSR